MFGAFSSVREQKKGLPPGSRTRRHVHTVETSPCGPRPWYLGPFAGRPTLYFFGPCGPRPWFLDRPPSGRPLLLGPCGPRPWCRGTPAERLSLYFFGPCDPRSWFLDRPPSGRPLLPVDDASRLLRPSATRSQGRDDVAAQALSGRLGRAIGQNIPVRIQSDH